MDSIKDILIKKPVNSNNTDTTIVNGNTVNSVDKSSITNTVNYVDRLTVDEKINTILEDAAIQPEAVAKMLAETLDDEKSLSYYTILVKEHGAPKMLEIMHYVKDVARTKILRNKALYFMAILKRKNIKTKFKKEDENVTK